MTAQLSCHVQNFVEIKSLESALHASNNAIEFEFWVKIMSETILWSDKELIQFDS